VGGEQDGAALVGLFAHGRPEALAGRDVHPCRRFVQDDQVAVAGRGEGEADALCLASGELVDLAVGDLRDPGAGHHVRRAVGPRVQVAGEADEFGDRHVVHQAAALEHRADLARDDRLPGRRPEQAHAARVGGLQAEQQVQRRGLPRAVGSEQCHGLPRAQAQRQPVHGADLAVRLAHLVELDHRSCRCHASMVTSRPWSRTVPNVRNAA